MNYQVCYRTGELSGYYYSIHAAMSEEEARYQAERNGVTRSNGFDIWAILPMGECNEGDLA